MEEQGMGMYCHNLWDMLSVKGSNSKGGFTPLPISTATAAKLKKDEIARNC